MKKQNKKIITFSVADSSISLVKEVYDSQFSLLEIRAFSDSVTSHGYKCSEKTLKRCAYTLLGVPILAYFNQLTEDFEGHENTPLKQESPCGFVPKNSTIKFEVDEHGVTYVVIQAYIWNLYFDYIMDVFEKRDGKVDVSVELLVLSSEDKDEYIEMTDLCFTAVTLLGENIKPASQNAHAVVIKFSEEDQSSYIKAKQLFEEKLYNSDLNNNQESSSLIENEDSFLCKKRDHTISKEENMAKKVLVNSVENTETIINSDTTSILDTDVTKVDNLDEHTKLDNAKQYVDKSVSEEIYTSLYDDAGNYIGSTNEYNRKSVTKTEEITEEEAKSKVDTVLNSDQNDEIDYKDEFAKLTIKFSELESEKDELSQNYELLKIKCSELEEYKKNKEDELKLQAIECAIDEVSDILSPEEIKNWKDKSITCTNVVQFQNELKAFAFDIQKNSGVSTKDPLRNSLPQKTEEISNNVWDRLEKLNN